MLVLGLDVSTACTGWAVLDSSGKLVDVGAIELSKSPSIYTKATMVRDQLSSIKGRYGIESVYIEENLQSFRRGFSSAKTLSTLARFNGVVSLISYEIFSVEPEHLNVNAARKSLGLKILSKKKGGADTKLQVLEWVKRHLEEEGSSVEWPLKTLKSGPRKGQVVLEPKCYDMADAYVIAAASIVL